MLVKTNDEPTYRLSHFEGPLSLLVHLIQKEELGAETFAVLEVVKQYKDRLELLNKQDIYEGGEFISATSTLLWLKSKSLLPIDGTQGEVLLEENDEAPYASISELIDYCKFKQAAKGLHVLEETSQGLYVRGKDLARDEVEKPLGIEHVTLNEFAALFNTVLQKSSQSLKTIKEEVFRVHDKIKMLRSLLGEMGRVEFFTLFTEQASREELVVTFLAVLELMKVGDLKIGKETKTGRIFIYPNKLKSWHLGLSENSRG